MRQPTECWLNVFILMCMMTIYENCTPWKVSNEGHFCVYFLDTTCWSLIALVNPQYKYCGYSLPGITE